MATIAPTTTIATPFSTSPDPFILYLTPSIKTALHKVKYVIDRKQGLTTIMGDGKQLELIRVMLNIETHKAKLVQIVLAAQLELRDKLRDETKKPSARASSTRLTFRP